MGAEFNNQIQIELHVPNFDVVKDFYSKLGFNIVWEQSSHGNENDYLVMQRDGVILNFWPGNDAVYDQPYFKNFAPDTKRGYGVEIVYMVDDIHSYYEDVSKFANVVEELKKQPWGLFDFRIEDPFGFYLRITEPHDIRDSSNAVES